MCSSAISWRNTGIKFTLKSIDIRLDEIKAAAWLPPFVWIDRGVSLKELDKIGFFKPIAFVPRYIVLARPTRGWLNAS